MSAGLSKTLTMKRLFLPLGAVLLSASLAACAAKSPPEPPGAVAFARSLRYLKQRRPAPRQTDWK